jgi:hypothetical protein
MDGKDSSAPITSLAVVLQDGAVAGEAEYGGYGLSNGGSVARVGWVDRDKDCSLFAAGE